MYHIHLIISHLIKNSINRVHSIESSIAAAIANTIRSSIAIAIAIKGNLVKEASPFARSRRTQVRPDFLNLRAFGLVSVLCLASFLTACERSSSDGSGSGPRPSPDNVTVVVPDPGPDPVTPSDPRSVFSHTSYNFAGLGATLTNADPAARILGSVVPDRNTILAGLPAGVSLDDVNISFRLEGSELANEFFEVNSTDGRVLFGGLGNYRRAFALDYVVNVLDVSEFEVVAVLSYINAADELVNAEHRVAIKIVAVTRGPKTTDFIRFDGKFNTQGIRTDSFNVTVNQSYTGQLSANADAPAEAEAFFWRGWHCADQLCGCDSLYFCTRCGRGECYFCG